MKNGRIVLTPGRDPVTGLPVLSAGPGAPLLTSEQVDDLRSNPEFEVASVNVNNSEDAGAPVVRSPLAQFKTVHCVS